MVCGLVRFHLARGPAGAGRATNTTCFRDRSVLHSQCPHYAGAEKTRNHIRATCLGLMDLVRGVWAHGGGACDAYPRDPGRPVCPRQEQSFGQGRRAVREPRPKDALLISSSSVRMTERILPSSTCRRGTRGHEAKILAQSLDLGNLCPNIRWGHLLL